MQTVTLSVRVPKAEADRWGQLARDAGIDRSTLLKQALRTGCASALFDRACTAYRSGEVTLARAAELAGVTLREMLLRLPQTGLELHYGVRDLEKDLAP
ncbi:MAG: UPF0175 family protein [bacterium]